MSTLKTISIQHPNSSSANIGLGTDGSVTVGTAMTFRPGELNIIGVATATTFSGNITGTAATFTGNISASTFSGNVTGTAATFSGAITAASASFSGNVSIAGTLTYEDVTNVDSIGLVTARSGIVLTGGNATLGTGVTISGSTANTFTLSTNGSERVRVDSSGRALFGISTARSNFFNTTLTSNFQIEGAGHNDSSFSLIRNQVISGTQFGPNLVLGSSGGTTNGSNTLSLINGFLGNITFQGTDGTEFVEAASIRGEVDGTPGANDMPGRLVFSTTADGSSSLTERLRIISTGAFGLSGANYGTSGQVLTSQGSGSAPQWATPAGGAWQFISSVTASSSSSVAFTSGIDSTYDVYAIVFNNVVQVGGTNADVYMRLSTNGGSTWISGTSDYNKSRDFDPSSYSQDSGIRIITILKSSTAPATPISGIVYLYNFNISGSVSSVSSLTLNSQNGVNIAFGGSTVASGVHNAVQIYPETTTMSGTFRLYGIKNS